MRLLCFRLRSVLVSMWWEMLGMVCARVLKCCGFFDSISYELNELLE